MTTLDQARQQIAVLRETKGQEQATLDLISQTILEAESQQAWEDLAHLYFEQHLSYQHLVMNQRSSANPDLNIISQNLELMLESTLKAQKIIEDHGLENLKGDLHRFLGRAYTYQDNHQKAALEYQIALEIFKNQNHPRFLEVQGFLSESLIRQRQIEEGINLAISTYKAYESDPLGQALKQSDYKTWLIWRTGIFRRLTDALLESKAPFDHNKIKDYLNKSLESLQNNPDFTYRIEEIQNSINNLI